jgi:hypothetical protein
LDSSADFWPISGLEPAPMPPVSFLADLDLILALGLVEVLSIGVNGNELNALDARGDHSIDDVVAGSADTDHLNRNDFLCKICHLTSSYVCHSTSFLKNCIIKHVI